MEMIMTAIVAVAMTVTRKMMLVVSSMLTVVMMLVVVVVNVVMGLHCVVTAVSYLLAVAFYVVGVSTGMGLLM